MRFCEPETPHKGAWGTLASHYYTITALLEGGVPQTYDPEFEEDGYE